MIRPPFALTTAVAVSVLAVTQALMQPAMAQTMTEPLLVGAPQPLFSAPVVPGATPTPAPDPVTGPTEPELRALIFYIRETDAAAASAELRRLRAKYPEWTPPSDLGAAPARQPSAEIDVIFQQIAMGQLAEARATLATTRATYQGWVPPADMTGLIELAEGQALLDAALDAGRADEAIVIAGKHPALLRCDRINNAWRIAEAQQSMGAREPAVRTYLAVVQACVAFPEITATLEKSEAVTTQDEMGSLFEIVMKRFPEQKPELDTLKQRLLDGRKGAAAVAGLPPAPNTGIRPKPRPDGLNTRTAAAPPLRAASNPASRGPDPAPAALRTGFTSGNWAQCLAQTENTRNTALLFDRGWCAYNLDRPMDSLSAFRAIEKGLPPEQRRDARFGMALAYLKLNMTEDAARIAATTDLTRKQRVETESIILDQRGVRAYRRGEFTKAIGYFSALEQVSGSLRRDLAIMRGYSYLNSGNRPEARRIFAALHNQLADHASAKGMADAAE